MLSHLWCQITIFRLLWCLLSAVLVLGGVMTVNMETPSCTDSVPSDCNKHSRQLGKVGDIISLAPPVRVAAKSVHIPASMSAFLC